MSKLTTEYVDAVTELANSKTNRRFLNDSAEHAKLLANLMIGKSSEEDTALIYSGELKEPCFNEALKSARGKIRILLDDPKGLEVLATISNRNRIQVRIAKPNQQKINHFFVCGSAFRVELDHGKATALANFNEQSVVDQLRAQFDISWEIATPANIPELAVG